MSALMSVCVPFMSGGSAQIQPRRPVDDLRGRKHLGVASGRTTFRLGDICLKIGSGATPRGGAEVYVDPGPYALIRSQNVYNNGFRCSGLVFIDEKHAVDLGNVEVRQDDVLLNITGDSVARCCQVDLSILPARVNQHVAIIRPDPGKLNPRFLRYFIVSPQVQSQLLSWAASGGTRNALTKGMIESLKVVAPNNVDEQRAIARILGTLDDKIELNRQMNQTLEAITHALFKSWFVDLDPVRARAEGREPSVSGELADLFPDRFEESELGEVPAGWEVRGLDEVADYTNGLPLQRYVPAGADTLPVIKIAQLRAGHTEGAERCSAGIAMPYIVDDGDVLFSWSGSLMVEIWSGGRGALNQHLFKVTSARYPKWFYYLWTKHHLPAFQGIAADKATTMGHIQRRHLAEAKALDPGPTLLGCTGGILAPLMAKVVANGVESRTLGAIRDALLPKLLSGEVRVKDAEEIVGRAI